MGEGIGDEGVEDAWGEYCSRSYHDDSIMAQL